MANTYDPASLGIKAPAGGFQQGGWYEGRQYWGGTLSDPGVINPLSDQVGAGQAVSAEVNAQSAAQQGKTPQELEAYLQQQRDKQAKMTVAPVSTRADYSAAGSTKGSNIASPGTGTGAGVGAINIPQPVDLVETYKKLTQESGVNEVQAEIDKKTKAFNDAQAIINDNPYYSEGTRTGRIAKLKDMYNNDITALTNQIATKKADIDTLMNLQTKQFDINSQNAQLALQQFNALLDAGALDNAAPEDIANITRSTGLSSAMIQSAVNAKKIAGYNTATQTFDDGVNEGFVVYTVDQMGNIINQVKQITGTSSKAKQYSSDKQVSDYIDAIIKGRAETNADSISDLWGGTSTTTSQSNQTFRYAA